MTMIEARSNGHGPPLHKLPDDEKRERARAMARADRTLTGKALAERFGMSPKWGQNQAAKARADAAARSGPAPVAMPRQGGTEPAAVPQHGGDGTGSVPRDVPRKVNGTAKRAGPSVPRHTPAARRRDTRHGPPVPLLAVTIAAVVVVTAVCAVVSYSHIRDLAVHAGAGGLAGWLPLGIDGLVVACSGSLIADRRQGQRGHPSAWAGLILGLAATLAANVIAVDPELVPIRVVQWTLAGYAPVALAVSGHLLLRMLDSEDG